jgi:glycosyltransferase involved in cell wall biosynthesis
MRILHVGSGFRPWRRGGLVAYTEDLMDEQVRRGQDVSYFFAGRQYPLAGEPRLKRWTRRGVPMLEVINSPLYDHGRQPALEIEERRLEDLARQVVAEVKPSLVHVHELAGLPFSLLDVLRESGIPTIATLQDYFPLCSTFRLIDSDGRVCLRREIGADCVATTASDPREPGLLVETTLEYHVYARPGLRAIRFGRFKRRAHRLIQRAGRAEAARRARREPDAAEPSAAEFQRRRDANVERLNRVDCVIAMSNRVAEIYTALGVDPARLRTVHLTLAHIERLTPRPAPHAPDRPLTFATLAGFESEPKGALLLIEAMRLLEGQARDERFRLLVLGHVDPRFRAIAKGMPGVEIGALFSPSELDSVLDDVDVGLMPSIWEEAYGYAGVEFLAKGIPVIANAIGGMQDYTRDGETGWRNESCSADGLARIIAGIIDRPEQVVELNERLISERDLIVKTMAGHADEMDAIYREVSAARA